MKIRTNYGTFYFGKRHEEPMANVEPVPIKDTTALRLAGDVTAYTLDTLPEYLGAMPFGQFEWRVNDVWRRARGSYDSADGPMVWLDIEPIPELDMRIHWTTIGGHVHCAVFCNGKAGDLVFGVDEWPTLEARFQRIAIVIPDGEPIR